MNTLIIKLNGVDFNAYSYSICADLVQKLGYKNQAIALEVNSAIIPKSKLSVTKLKPNDKVEIVKAVGGG